MPFKLIVNVVAISLFYHFLLTVLFWLTNCLIFIKTTAAKVANFCNGQTKDKMKLIAEISLFLNNKQSERIAVKFDMENKSRLTDCWP